jgi:DNA-binding transcriptional LysR family regulator
MEVPDDLNKHTIMSMNLNHLRAFVAVAESLSFSRAANRLHISQPALSHQIRLLEEELETRLFLRDRRNVRLSATGQEILDDVVRLLDHADAIRHRARSSAKGCIGTLRIGFVASATHPVIPRMTQIFHKAFPKVALSLKNIPTVQQIDALRDHRIDIGVVRLPLHEPDIEIFPLFSEPFAVVFSRQHPLREKQKFSLRDLEKEPFVSYCERQAPAFFQHWTGLCRKSGFTPRIVQEASEMETVLALVSTGVGVAIVPQEIARRHKSSLVVLPLTRERIRSEIGLAFLRRNPAPLVQHMVHTLASSGLFERPSRRR